MQAAPRFRFITKKQPGTFRFSVRVVEIQADGTRRKRRKSKKEKRRLRKVLRAQRDKQERVAQARREEESPANRPSYRQSPGQLSGSLRR